MYNTEIYSSYEKYINKINLSNISHCFLTNKNNKAGYANCRKTFFDKVSYVEKSINAYNIYKNLKQ